MRAVIRKETKATLSISGDVVMQNVNRFAGASGEAKRGRFKRGQSGTRPCRAEIGGQRLEPLRTTA